jgi:type IV pilus assembly protein PilA
MMEKSGKTKGFTLVELMVVIMVVAILAAVSFPILRGRTRQAKWSEAAATAGTIRIAIRACYTKDPISTAAMTGSTVDTIQGTLGFTTGDLNGRYFQAGNFQITAIDGNGHSTITVAAPVGLFGSGVLSNSGWVYSP